MAAWFGAQTKTSFGTQSIISPRQGQPLVEPCFHGSSKRSCNDMGLVPKFSWWRSYRNEIIKARYLFESRNERLNNYDCSTSEVFVDV